MTRCSSLAGRRSATEAQAVSALVPRLDHSFVRACRLCLECKGRVVVTGMGKSGHVGSKIAATLASTGTPAFFLHPAEASHGDIGMITRQDVVLAISNSGETAEIATLVPHIRRLGIAAHYLHRQRGFDAGTRRDRQRRCQRSGRSVPAQPRADGEHHGHARDGRCDRGRAAQVSRLHRSRTSRAPIPAEAWDGACCCMSRTSCAPARTCRWSLPTRRSRRA